jgi:hypothetical protein
VHRWSTTCGPIPQIIQFQNKSRNRLFQEFCKEAPRFPQNQPTVPDFAVRPPELKNNSKKVPSLRKMHKNSLKTSKFHIFSTTTPNLVIPSPKFSGSLLLSFYAFI